MGRAGGLRFAQAAGVAQSLAQDKFDLRVQAAQVISRPALHRVVYRRVQPQQEWFSLRQNPPNHKACGPARRWTSRYLYVVPSRGYVLEQELQYHQGQPG